MKKKISWLIFLASIGLAVHSQTRKINERYDVQRTKNPDTKKAARFNELSLVTFKFKKGYTRYTIGEQSLSVNAVRTVESFKINRYETTYALWYKVRTWAELNGYMFSNPGQEGSEGLRGKAPTELKKYEPVTNINWYDAAVWCNALSEMTGCKPCYTYRGEILRDSTDTVSMDQCKCDFDCNGYRLPAEAEWEYASRKTRKSLQSSALASGQADSEGNEDTSVSTGSVSWYYENSKGTHTVGTAGLNHEESTTPNPGSGKANGTGLFDMSGNVLEFCFDWHSPYTDQKERQKKLYTGPELGKERVMRGGSFNEYTMFVTCGERYSYDPNEAYSYFGFRIAQSYRDGF